VKTQRGVPQAAGKAGIWMFGFVEWFLRVSGIDASTLYLRLTVLARAIYKGIAKRRAAAFWTLVGLRSQEGRGNDSVSRELS